MLSTASHAVSAPAALDFCFKDPDRGFDRSRVKGTVASLVRLKDGATTTALEVAAGGKLYQVVVDSDRTAQALLSRGQLRNRVTIIPLNKVRTSPGEALLCAEAVRGTHRLHRTLRRVQATQVQGIRVPRCVATTTETATFHERFSFKLGA